MARRKFDIFSLSFLDAICCGFGSAVLIFMLITAQGGSHVRKVTEAERSEVLKVDERLRRAQEDFALLEARAGELGSRRAADARESARLVAALESARTSPGSPAGDSAVPGRAGGGAVRPFPGSGDRMYLTGLNVRGARVLVLIDVSTSMLDATLVNILRMRNMSDEQKRRSAKWRQALAIADWIAAQLPPGSEFQMYAFNAAADALVEGSDGRWLKVGAPTLGRALAHLGRIVPGGGTSLDNAFAVASVLKPAPDQLIILTDGLPTQGAKRPAAPRLVGGDERLRLFEHAVSTLPHGVPVNVILLPMEGDPDAAGAFWQLARTTAGSFMAPSRDWP